MTVAFYSEFPQAPLDVAEHVVKRVNEQVGADGPAGGIYHAEGPLGDGGWWTFNVWESSEAAQRFFGETVAPILQELGRGIPDTPPRALPVYWESNNPLPFSATRLAPSRGRGFVVFNCGNSSAQPNVFHTDNGVVGYKKETSPCPKTRYPTSSHPAAY